MTFITFERKNQKNRYKIKSQVQLIFYQHYF